MRPPAPHGQQIPPDRGPLAPRECVPRRVRRGQPPPPPPVDWAAALAPIARPAGMLPAWRLGVLLSTATASVGWIEPGRDGASPSQHVGTLSWSDIGWMRRARAPRPGDVLMIQPGGPQTVALRQIPDVEGAIVSMDPNTGRVLAMVGGWAFDMSQFNRATQALRQPGSSFKPIVYLAAMEDGISPAEKFLDAPFVNGTWRPNNYELTYSGPTSLHDALRRSLNLVTIRLAAHIGMDKVAQTAIALHEVDAMPKVLPAALGAVETTVLREAGAYSTLATGGREVLPSLIDSVQDRDGHVIWHPEGLSVAAAAGPGDTPAIVDARKQVADPQSTYQVVRMMEDVMTRGTGRQAADGIDRPLAGKTGTSQDFNDAWFAGFSPNLLTIVWVGFDNPRSLGDKEDGGHVAGPIWNQYMKQALAGRPVADFRVPDGITLVRYNTGEGETIDGFKPGQIPGTGNLIASDNPSQLGPEDTGAENVPDSEAEMAGTLPPGGSTTSVDAGSSALATPASPVHPGSLPPGAPPAVLAGVHERQPAPANPPPGGDIGMGGLY